MREKRKPLASGGPSALALTLSFSHTHRHKHACTLHVCTRSTHEHTSTLHTYTQIDTDSHMHFHMCKYTCVHTHCTHTYIPTHSYIHSPGLNSSIKREKNKSTPALRHPESFSSVTETLKCYLPVITEAWDSIKRRGQPTGGRGEIGGNQRRGKELITFPFSCPIALLTAH